MTAITPAKKVLLLGAFANGNIGDAYQAEVLAAELRAVDPGLEISSVSPSRRGDPYPADNHVALPSEAIHDAATLNAFDVILVGGGGLLAAPHAPLNDPDWVAGIETRLCAVGLGCAGDAPLASRAFVERCDRFSARDEYSVAAVGDLRDDVELVMDPILLGDLMPELEPLPQEGLRGIACVAGKLLPATTPFYETLQRDFLTDRADSLISLNEETDRTSGFDQVFERPIVYARSIEDVLESYRGRAFAVSERYHGCILAIKWGMPCFGIALRSQIVTSKITELYRRLGIGGAIIRTNDDLNRSRLKRQAEVEFDPDAIGAALRRERQVLRDYLRSCLG
jgi:hypothetical protein